MCAKNGRGFTFEPPAPVPPSPPPCERWWPFGLCAPTVSGGHDVCDLTISLLASAHWRYVSGRSAGPEQHREAVWFNDAADTGSGVTVANFGGDAYDSKPQLRRSYKALGYHDRTLRASTRACRS